MDVETRGLWATWQRRVRQLKRETYALYLATRDPRTPWYAKVLAAAVVAHTFSPIDLIPDFIPVLGYLDDLIIAPVGIWLALRMIPAEVMAESRAQAEAVIDQERPTSWIAAAVIVAIWVIVGASILALLWDYLGG